MKSKRMKALLFMSMAVLATACGKEEVNTAESQTQITEGHGYSHENNRIVGCDIWI